MTFEEYLNSAPVRKLQLGCGGNILPGWLNTDGQNDGWAHPHSVKLNAAEPFPLPDAVFDYVYSEHMIEHLTFAQGQVMLSECFRVMRPGARIRISCPGLEFLIKMYQDPNALEYKYINDLKPEWAPYPSAIFTFNNFVRDWGHQFIYDRPTLVNCLLAAGFDNITEHAILESSDPNLQNLEVHGRLPPGMLQLETMTFEATRPL
jgi:predicted SAM-dependent methyltransferase